MAPVAQNPRKSNSLPLSRWLFSLFALGGLAAPSNAGASFEPEAPQSHIANGKPAGECALPAVVHLKMGNTCTGTLIHPQVVLYAAHCFNLRQVILGENGRGPVITKIKKSVTHPDFSESNSSGPKGAAIDWAVGVLEEPVNGVPVIPLAYAGELEKHQKAGQSVVLTGYGKTESGMSSANLIWATAKIEQVSNGSMTTVKGRQNACSGDSGGPVLVKLEDGSWRVMGIMTNLGPTLSDCGKDTGYNRMSQVRREMVEWLEKQTGFDLTPCYDMDGKADRSESCKNLFAGDISAPSGSWSKNCADAKVVEEPKLLPVGGEEEPKDETAPKVEIKAPEDNHVMVGESIEIKIEASDDEELEEVSLYINDKKVKSWKEEPFEYEWEVESTASEISIHATAEDKAGNEAKSKSVSLLVVVDDPGTESPTTGENSSTESPKTENNDDETPDPKTPDEPSDEPTATKDETSDKPADPQAPPSSSCSTGGDLAPMGGFALLAGLLGLRRRRRS